MTRLTPISFDIETTGFGSESVVTTVGFVMPLGCRVFLNTAAQPVAIEDLESRLEDTFETTIHLTEHQTEPELLAAVTEFAQESIAPHEYMLVAYNGERFRGGFDLPFLRTRYIRHDLRWPFVDIPYADLMPIFNDQFNTVIADESASDLERVYETLIDEELTSLDPFESSKAAVPAFENGDFEQLLAHNIADILRTDKLATVAERYCSKSDFRLKSLTPTAHDSSLTQQ